MVRYEDIQRNIAKLDVQNDNVTVVWKCPLTEKELVTTTERMQANRGLQAGVQKDLVSGAVRSAQGWFSQLARSLLGYEAGRAVQNIGSRLQQSASNAATYGEQEQKDAILRAWEQAKGYFVYSEECFAYVDKNAKAAGAATAPAGPPPIPGSGS